MTESDEGHRGKRGTGVSDQLSFALGDGQLGAWSPFRPMVPRPGATAFDDSDYLFEPWWGGERAFLVVEPARIGVATMGGEAGSGSGAVRVFDRHGRDLAPALPELADLAGQLSGHSAVLDGCLVVVDGRGRPDRRALRDRLAGRSGRLVAYLAFDLVGLDGRPLLAEPLERRRERLERTVTAAGSLLVVPAIPGEGRALHAAAIEQGIPAIVGRHRQSPYLPGVRSRLWRLVSSHPLASPAADDAVRRAAAPMLALIQRLPFEETD